MNINMQYPADPCSLERILEFESKLKRKLPSEYVDFIRQTGGGVLGSENCLLKIYDVEGIEIHQTVVNIIFGNGQASNGVNVDLIDEVGFLAEEWEISSDVQLFAVAESGMHECFAFNYGLAEYPKGSVLYIDNESATVYKLVADSFCEFLSKLGPNLEAGSRQSGDVRKVTALEIVREGISKGKLATAIAQCPQNDIEKLLRKSLEPLCRGFGIEMNVTEDSFRAFDLFFYLAQNVIDGIDKEYWSDLSYPYESFNFWGLVDDNFNDERGFSAISTGVGIPGIWWKNREERQVLVNSPTGYRIREEYIEWLMSELRS